MKNALLERFIAELPSRVLMLAAIWEDFCQKKEEDAAFLEELAGVLIFNDTLKDLCLNKGLSDFAQSFLKIDALLNDINDEDPVKNKKIREKVSFQIERLYKATESQARGMGLLGAVEVKEDGSVVQISEQDSLDERRKEKNKQKIADQKAKEKAVSSDDVGAEGKMSIGKRSVFLVSQDVEFLHECSVQIGPYGYEAHCFDSFEAFKVGMSMGTPLSVVVDYELVEKDRDTQGELGLFQSLLEEKNVPLLVVGSGNDFQIRLKAVRAGSLSFFSKPVNVSFLLDKLDAIISNAFISDPFKVLVVDDSETMIRFISRTLTQAGMLVHVEQSPDKVLQAIGDFNPDLILMDMYMPFCDGQELSRIIRQYESYTSIPIVFLSSETDIKKQLAAMQIGADDFLTKPIDPEHLVMSVNTRVQRHRILSSYMVRDSLTGLLNHTKVKQRLEQSVQKVARSKTPISFAMIDIDFFKKVNDTYGHPMGDRVIKSLSRLLQRRLRKTDAIGRYGGEEFAVIFMDTDAAKASKILDEIRKDFAKIEHHHESKVFSCTFSAGVASFPEYPDAQALSNSADKALYVAKQKGRNQVIIASD